MPYSTIIHPEYHKHPKIDGLNYNRNQPILNLERCQYESLLAVRILETWLENHFRNIKGKDPLNKLPLFKSIWQKRSPNGAFLMDDQSNAFFMALAMPYILKHNEDQYYEEMSKELSP